MDKTANAATSFFPFSQLPLGHAEDAFAPWLDAPSLHAHRQYHARLIAELNEEMADLPALHGRSIESILRTPMAAPAPRIERLMDVAGAHANHQFFWKIIAPPQSAGPDGALARAIDQAFGGLDGLQSAWRSAAQGMAADGWLFLSLVPHQAAAPLEIIALPGNGSVLPLDRPGVLCCDLWQHAYARQHGQHRDAWLESYWHIVDWPAAGRRLDAFLAGASQV